MGNIVTPDQVGWGSYGTFEGPLYRGQYSYTIPSSPTFEDKVMSVIASTEGKLDGVNMYDRCVVSVGLIQWCDAQYFLTTKLLGHVAEKLNPTVVIVPLMTALSNSNAAFKKFPDDGWRFQFLDERGKVKDINMQRELYFKGTGLKNSWSDTSKKHAKIWCAGLANIWNNPDARRVQIEYTKTRLMGFVTPSVKKDFFDVGPTSDFGPWPEVARAAYVSFAANIPLVASRMYSTFTASTKEEKWTEGWTIGLMNALTWGPEIKIYPGRYDRIRPEIEKNWNVEVPKNAQALKAYVSIPDRSPQPHPPLNVDDESRAIDADHPEIDHPIEIVDSPTKIVPIPVEPGGLFGILMSIIRFILSLFMKSA